MNKETIESIKLMRAVGNRLELPITKGAFKESGTMLGGSIVISDKTGE